MNEAEARLWIGDILNVMGRGAELTATTIDDKMVTVVTMAVNNDVVWGWMWAVIQRGLDGRNVMEMEVAVPVEVVAACEACGDEETELDPFTIIAIIDAIMKLIDLFRRR